MTEGISAALCRALLGVLRSAHPRSMGAATAAVYAAIGAGRQPSEEDALRHLMHLERLGYVRRIPDPFGAGELRWEITEEGRSLP